MKETPKRVLQEPTATDRCRLDRGATAVEYAIVAALIAAVIVVTVTLVGLDTLENWVLSW